MNKKILISISIIGLAAVFAVGGTGAWWNDTAQSTANTFEAGNMNLKLSNGNGWEESVTTTWDYDSMTPGGDSVGTNLRLQNQGNTSANYLKISASTTPEDGGTNMDKHMRITKLAYAGESLLEGGAGADLDSYEAPENCDIEVNFGADDYDTISKAVTEVGDGQVICVGSGTYSSDWEATNEDGYSITVDTPNITIAGVNNPDGNDAATVSITDSDTSEAFLVNADGVTIQGLHLTGSGTTFNKDELAGIQISPASDEDNVENVTIAYNIIEEFETTASAGSSKGIQWWADTDNYASLKNSVIKHNKISGIDSENKGGYGIQTVGDMDGTTIKHNTISHIDGAWGAGIALDAKQSVQTTNVLVSKNQITNSIWSASEMNSPISIQVEHNVDQTGFTIEKNNIRGLLHGGGDAGVASGDDVKAQNNWWGDHDPSDQVFGPVDTGNYLNGPHVGFVNGIDHNENGFADLHDLYGITGYGNSTNPIVIEDPQLETNGDNEQPLNLQVQLDGPTADQDDQNSSVGLNVNIEMGQGPVNQ